MGGAVDGVEVEGGVDYVDLYMARYVCAHRRLGQARLPRNLHHAQTLRGQARNHRTAGSDGPRAAGRRAVSGRVEVGDGDAQGAQDDGDEGIRCGLLGRRRGALGGP